MTSPLAIDLSRSRQDQEETTVYATATVTSWTASGNNTLNRNAETIQDAASLNGASYNSGDLVACIRYRNSYLVLGLVGASASGAGTVAAGVTAGSPAPYWRRSGNFVQLGGRIQLSAGLAGGVNIVTGLPSSANDHRFALVSPGAVTPTLVTAGLVGGQLWLPWGGPAGSTEVWLDGVTYTTN